MLTEDSVLVVQVCMWIEVFRLAAKAVWNRSITAWTR